MQSDLHDAKCLNSWYDAASPEVSVIVLNFNKSELTAKCLRHLWAHTGGEKFEIIVVDNGSDADEFRKLSEISGNFHLLRLPVNRYFGEGNNIGVQASRGKYLVFLNNDAFVTEGWLQPLIDVLDHQLNAGGVGPKFLYPDGRLQEAGAFIDENGFAIQRGKNYPMDTAEQNRMAIVDYCSAACFMTTRKLFDAVAGFDALFEPAYYEDTDLCFKIASLGHFIYYCPNSVVHHVENATTVVASELKGLAGFNRGKFLARWGSYLSDRKDNLKASIAPLVSVRRSAADVGQDKPVAVFYSSSALLPGGDERCMLAAASALLDSHRIYIASAAVYSDYRLDFLAREFLIDLSGAKMTTAAQLQELGPIDIFFHLGKAKAPVMPALGRRNFYMCRSVLRDSISRDAIFRSALSSYDCILVNSRFTRDILSSRLKAIRLDQRIEILPPPIQSNSLASRRATTISPRPIILSIGRFGPEGSNHRHDVLIEAIRRLSKAGVVAELHLVGMLHWHPEQRRHYKRMLRLAKGLPVHFHTNASSAVLSDLLEQATIYWHATGFGIDPKSAPEKCENSGASVIEAMAAGCVPFVVPNGCLAGLCATKIPESSMPP